VRQKGDGFVADRTGIFAGEDPFALARSWLAEAEASEPNDPNAIALATVDATGLPNVRMVLLKEVEEAAFVFYTNYESRKAEEIEGAGGAAFVMHWKSLRRQVRVRGPIARVEAPGHPSSRGRSNPARRFWPRWPRSRRGSAPTRLGLPSGGAIAWSRSRSSSGPMAPFGFMTASDGRARILARPGAWRASVPEVLQLGLLLVVIESPMWDSSFRGIWLRLQL
jgi:hypothetical protein